MGWVQDMTARWTAILRTTGGGAAPVDEAVRQVNAIFEPPVRSIRSRRLRRGATAAPETAAVTVLCRQLIAGVLVSDILLDQICVLTGQTREQALDRLLMGGPAGHLQERQLRALQAELSGSCALLRDPERASYAGLGDRIEHLLRLAEEQASALIDAARAEAAEIVSSAAAQPLGSCAQDAHPADTPPDA